MDEISGRTMANLDVVLEEVCRALPYGGDHELRKSVAQKLLDSAVAGTGGRDIKGGALG
jgi:hypothetical protein